MEDIIVRIDGKEHHVKVEETPEGKIKVYAGGEVFEIDQQPGKDLPSLNFGKAGGAVEEGTIVAPLPGVVTAVNVKPGDKVGKGQVLVKIIAMKMENEILAPRDGEVKEVRAKKDANVNKGEVVVVLK
ncbi:biotin/lipoyl-binding protein [Candidatus Woesearchaeota archaeon]|nr:MAG: biotin/lipoyl attachment protein [archaeon GW2011_AR11]MBS3111304.1 biotin/lipoyl-binding protein [Candidatus Woesearchaeota archaeon]HII64978.1 biotin/lipoyl-binding protein [Candidatus Woesearchaeota archaeon]